jgi:hypothetical protein
MPTRSTGSRLQRHKPKPITTAVLRRAVRALAAQVVKGAAREKRGTPPPHFVSRHRHFSWWSGILVLSVIGGCSRGGDPRGSGAVERALIQPDFVIGLIDGDSAYLFGDVVSVAVDENGRTYVGDRIGALVRAYDNDGQYLARIARAGEGPGEIYGWPADVTAGPSGRLYVRDGSRVTVFGSPNGNGVPDSVVAIWPLPGYGNLSSTRSRVGRSGEYYYPNYLFRDGELPRFFYLPFVEGQPTGDTLEVPPYPNLTGQRTASYRTGPGGGRLLQGLSHVPFAPLPVWDVTQTGTILSSTGAEYVLIETSIHGDTLRVISGPSSGLVEIAATERADSARALDARLDTLPVPIDEVSGLGPGVRDRQLPTTLPAVIAIHVAINGSIWVETWPPEGQSDSRFFDVLDDEGRLLTRAELRAPLTRDPPPFFGERYVVGVLRDPDTGVERVVRFTIPSQPATPVAR